MYCTTCGSAIDPGAAFCGSCGAPAPTSVASTTPPPPSASPATAAGPPPGSGPLPGPASALGAHAPTGPPPGPFPGGAAPVGPPPDLGPPPSAGSGASGSRRGLWLGIGAVVLVVAVVGGFLALRSDDDGGSAGGDGDTIVLANGQHLQLAGPAPASAPKRTWHQALRCNDQCGLATDGTRVFTAQEEDDEKFLEAFDAADGSSLWKNTTFDPGEYGVYLDVFEGLVFVRTETDDGGAGITAVDATDGKVRWTAKGSWQGLVGDDGTLLLDRGGDSSDRTSAVGMDDGKERWAGRGRPAALCAGKAVLAGEQHDVQVVDARTGKEVWSKTVDEPGSATCGGDVVVVATEAGAAAYDLASGKAAWTATVRGAQTVATTDDLAVVAGGPAVVALRLDDGKEAWRHDDAPEDFASFLLPVTESRALASTDDHDYLVDLATGKTAKRIESSEVNGVGSDAVVYVDDDDDMHAWDLKTFRAMWTITAPKHTDNLVVGGGRLVVLAEDAITAYA